MPMMTFMADVLRDAGLPVREVPGWQTRGHGAMGSVLGVLAHHTAGPATGDFPSERVVVNGRTGLAGPLCNLGLTRSGTWVVVAAGQAWHAGTGSVSWCPANSGNSRLIGVEAESVGTRDDWTAAQRSNYPRGVAALLRHLRLPASRVIGHKEWAPTRKIDPAFWDMNNFRADTARWMTEEDPLMSALSDAEQRELLDHARALTRWLAPTEFVPPGGDPARPWSITTGQAAANVYVATFFGGPSTEGRSLFQAIADAAGKSGHTALSEADVQRIAKAVIAGLPRGTSPAAPGLAQVYEFTGTATPKPSA